MSRKIERITITIPADLVKRADARAEKEGRSRSWVLSEALRAWLDRPAPAVREPATAPYTVRPGLSEQRLALLESDLKLTPAERLRNADAATEDAFRIHRVPRIPVVMAFERYEDFLEWKRRDLLW